MANLLNITAAQAKLLPNGTPLYISHNLTPGRYILIYLAPDAAAGTVPPSAPLYEAGRYLGKLTRTVVQGPNVWLQIEGNAQRWVNWNSISIDAASAPNVSSPVQPGQTAAMTEAQRQEANRQLKIQADADALSVRNLNLAKVLIDRKRALGMSTTADNSRFVALEQSIASRQAALQSLRNQSPSLWSTASTYASNFLTEAANYFKNLLGLGNVPTSETGVLGALPIVIPVWLIVSAAVGITGAAIYGISQFFASDAINKSIGDYKGSMNLIAGLEKDLNTTFNDAARNRLGQYLEDTEKRSLELGIQQGTEGSGFGSKLGTALQYGVIIAAVAGAIYYLRKK